MIILTELPYPPSVNDSLAVFRGRMIKTAKARAYKEQCHIFTAKNITALNQATTQIKSWLDQGLGIKVDCYFSLPEEKILTAGKKAIHRFKKSDVSNRVKLCHDALSDMLRIDDLYFIAGNAEKVIGPMGVTVYVTPHKLQSLDEVKTQWIRKTE